MSQYFAKQFRSFGENIDVKVDHSNYATKIKLKNVAHIDFSSSALKTNLATLKLAPVLVDLSKLSDAVKNNVAKRAVDDTLAAKVSNI